MNGTDANEHEPYIVIEERSAGIGPFLVGAALGATIALLFAPRTGVETRAAIRRRARLAQAAARQAAEGVAERVTDTFADARDQVERGLESARASVSKHTRQFSDAVAAGRSAARQAERELRSELERARGGRASTGPVRPVSSSPAGRRSVKREPLPGPGRSPRGGH